MKHSKSILLKQFVKGFVLVFVVVLVFYFLKSKFDFTNLANLEYIQSSIMSFGVFAPLIFIVLMAIAIVISPIPSLPLSVVAGTIWGPYLATVYSVFGGLIGAIISFFLARFLGRSFLENVFKKKFNFFDSVSDKFLFWVVLISRLFPFFQFDVISYGAGLTKLSAKKFAIATFFGMIPMTFIFAKFGSVLFLGNLTSILLSVFLIILIFVAPLFLKKFKFFKSVV